MTCDLPAAHNLQYVSAMIAPASHHLTLRPAMPTKSRCGTAPAANGASAELRVLFGANLRQARHKAGLSQEDVAAHAGIHQPRVSEAECGVYNVTLETMVILADAVGVEVWQLLRSRRRPDGG